MKEAPDFVTPHQFIRARKIIRRLMYRKTHDEWKDSIGKYGTFEDFTLEIEGHRLLKLTLFPFHIQPPQLGNIPSIPNLKEEDSITISEAGLVIYLRPHLEEEKEEEEEKLSNRDKIKDAINQLLENNSKADINELLEAVKDFYPDIGLADSSIQNYLYRITKDLREENKLKKVGNGNYMKIADYDLNDAIQSERNLSKDLCGDMSSDGRGVE